MHLSPSLAAEVNGYRLTSSATNNETKHDNDSRKCIQNDTYGGVLGEQLSPTSSDSSMATVSKFKMTDYSLPITTTYLSQLRHMRLANSSIEEVSVIILNFVLSQQLLKL